MVSLPALTWIERFDRGVLRALNCDLYDEGVADVLFFLQRKEVGVPLVVVLALVIARTRGRAVALRTLGACALAFVLSWQVAAVMWRAFERPRPPKVLQVLRTPEAQAACASHPDAVAPRKYVSSRPGMPSQHAQHSAGFALVLFLALRWAGLLAAVYALFVGCARVTMGAHWPTDVLAGFALGPPIAWLAWWLLPHLFGLVGLRRWVAPPVLMDSQGTAGAADAQQ